jgi:hypothetical protein
MPNKALQPTVLPPLLAEPLKSGKAGTLTRSRRKSHECGLAARGLWLRSES